MLRDLIILLFLSTALSLIPTQAQGEPQTKVIYGEDNRQELYQVEREDYRDLARSTAALVKTFNIQMDGGRAVLQTRHYGSQYGLCSTEPFFEQPLAAFCSGFLVAPDIMATAGHCLRSQYDCQSTSFVFGFSYETQNSDPTSLSTSDVYSCKSIIASQIDGGGADFSLIRLDRPVLDRTPLILDRKSPTVHDSLVVMGHPAGLPLKIADGAQVRSVHSGHFVANLDTYGGNSGSAVFNESTGRVVGILVRGETDFIYKNNCRVSKICEQNGCRGEDVTRISALPNF